MRIFRIRIQCSNQRHNTVPMHTRPRVRPVDISNQQRQRQRRSQDFAAAAPLSEANRSCLQVNGRRRQPPRRKAPVKLSFRKEFVAIAPVLRLCLYSSVGMQDWFRVCRPVWTTNFIGTQSGSD
ncbi:uncharacterized protein BDW70DRAFT_35990 [Aspergillus foveolatus]|uniref:uncharacterized protein n=1 Tax=Aspergillus foveolatus TaxID=210207 RepID=UPI003CCE0E38